MILVILTLIDLALHFRELLARILFLLILLFYAVYLLKIVGIGFIGVLVYHTYPIRFWFCGFEYLLSLELGKGSFLLLVHFYLKDFLLFAGL